MSTVATTPTETPVDTNAGKPNDPTSESSDVVRGLQTTVHEMSRRLAQYEAIEQLEETKKREQLQPLVGKAQTFVDDTNMLVAESEREQFAPDFEKAKSLYGEIATMPRADMERFQPLLVIASKASGTTDQIKELHRKLDEASTTLKRKCEENEQLSENCRKQQVTIQDVTKLSETRQAQLESTTKELQMHQARASRHDFSTPSIRQYNNGIDAMRKHVGSTQSHAEVHHNISTAPPPTELANNGKAPAAINNLDAAERATVMPHMASTLTTTTMCASAGGSSSSAGSSDPPPTSTPSSMLEHVGQLSHFFMTRSTPTTSGRIPSSLRPANSQNDNSTMSDADRVLAFMR